MKEIGFNKIILSIMLSTIAIIDIVSLYFLYSIDQIINGDLYNYGLIFNLNWANNYWINRDSVLITIFASLILAGVSLILLYNYDLKNNKKTLTASSILYLAIGFTTIINIFQIIKIDTIVASDLANYGVQYVFQWTSQYHFLSRSLLGLKIVTIAISSTLSTWALLILYKSKRTISKLISILLQISGTVTFISSVLFDLATGITIGLGLILTGLIIGYITSQQYVKKEILTSQLTTAYRYLEEYLKKIEKYKKVVYTPQELTKQDNVLIILINQKENILSNKKLNTKKILDETTTLIPPGNELAKLFEKELKINLAKTNLSYLIKNLPKLVVEDLEIASSFQMKIQNETIEIEFENSIFNNIIFNQRFSETLRNFGCPLSSAIGCAIAKATGKFTSITEYQIDEQRKSSNVTYQLI
jgi:hypothetical protein